VGTDRAVLGGRGEQRAAEHLVSLGYEIIERNYRCRYGEIDLIAKEGGDLVFVEVKSRRSNSFGFPSEAVDRRKQEKLIKTAQRYVVERSLGEVDSRFDVVEVNFTNGCPVQVHVIKAAFWAGY
jgi:putative endonuclease